MFDSLGSQAKLDRAGSHGRTVVKAVTLAAMVAVVLVAAAPAQAHRSRLGLRSAAPSAEALSQALHQTTGLTPTQVTVQDICPVASPGAARCAGQALVLRSNHALVRPHVRRHDTLGRVRPALAHGLAGPAAATASSSAPPLPGTPAYLQQAYDLAYLSQTGGGASTIAIVDAFNNPNAESDLGVYRSTYGLPPCTTANGCFRKVNQTGGSTPPSTHDANWAIEESLDLDAVSALCPKCHILLVEANSAMSNDLAAAQATAASLHATQISDSWTVPVTGGGILAGSWVFNGIATIAATGDTGYLGTTSDNFPAAFYGVTAAGGTSLAPVGGGDARGFSESAWSLDSKGQGASSGCAVQVSKPKYQTDTGCTGRAYADLSADADPSTGLNVYDSEQPTKWLLAGGTSLATPLIAAYYAIAGVSASSTPRWAYVNSASLNDPVTGSTGTCDPTIRYICNAGRGYDGPTGVGSISGMAATGAPGIGGPANGSAGTTSYTQSTRTHGATIEGGIYPNGLDTKWWIEYGTGTSYGQQTFQTDIGSGASPVAVTGYLSHLDAATTYHYRLVAQNSTGTTYGYDYTFTTPASTATDPTASFTSPALATPNSPAPFDATGSFDTGASITDYTWDFGDNTVRDIGPSGTTSHNYASPGIYNVTLIVTNSSGQSDSTSKTITIDNPQASFAPPQTIPSPGSPAAFDASASTDPIGTINDYQWNFGDGTGTVDAGNSPKTMHTFAIRGNYVVTLTVTNSFGQTATATHVVTADIPPTAAFTAPGGAQLPGSALSFNASTSSPGAGGTITGFSWDYGDHTTLGTGLSPSHTYTTPGRYNVLLTVTDDLGVTNTTSRTVTVDQPHASFTAPSAVVAPNALAAFDATGSSDPLRSPISDYRWNFGDGSGTLDSGSSPTTTHSYSTRGTYSVTVTVTNGYGQTNTAPAQLVTVDIAPTAAFTAPAGPQQPNSPVSFDATPSTAPGGSIRTYSWNFGDGSTGTGSNPSHTYSSPDRYTVTLNVTDDLGVTSTATTHSVNVDAAPSASFSASPNPAALGPGVAFDARGSSDSLGTITSYQWDFGDGSTGSGATASHGYRAPGPYTITLTVTNDAGQTATTSRSITVDAAPSSSFSVSPTTARTGAPVAFNAGSSSDTVGTISAYAWNFGDGATASGLNTSHVFSRPGSYTVALTVTNDAGQSATSTHSVTVYAAPSASFSVTPATTLPGALVNFNAAGSSNPGGTITGYSWNFGDASGTSGPSASHAYRRPGTYTVTLTVTGNLGLATSTTHTVTVVPPPLSARLSARGRQKLTAALKHGVVVSVSTNTAAKASFVVTMPPPGGKRVAKARTSTVLRTGARSFAAGRHSTSLKLSRAAATRLRAAGKPVVLTLHMTLTDVYGRRATRSIKVTLTR